MKNKVLKIVKSTIVSRAEVRTSRCLFFSSSLCSTFALTDAELGTSWSTPFLDEHGSEL